MYLFDSALGCVYVLYGWNFTKWNLGRDDDNEDLVIKLRRVNVPYERFFKCQEDRFPVVYKVRQGALVGKGKSCAK